MSFRSKTYEFKVWGRHALFTDPVTKIGGEKCSYHIPTYEALKGVAKSIYWKPTIVWVIDEVRVMNAIRTQTKGTKPINFGGVYPSASKAGVKQESLHTLAIYTFLADVEYQVRAHFEWNQQRPELESDRNAAKHLAMTERALKRGGRQDIFLGTRDCQAYVEPCAFGSGKGHYDALDQLGFGLMFHGFDYPDETGVNQLNARFWNPKMLNGVISFSRPDDCTIKKYVRDMESKQFVQNENFSVLTDEEIEA